MDGVHSSMNTYTLLTPGGLEFDVFSHENVRIKIKRKKYDKFTQALIEKYGTGKYEIIEFGSKYGFHTVLLGKLNPDAVIRSLYYYDLETISKNLSENEVSNVDLFGTSFVINSPDLIKIDMDGKEYDTIKNNRNLLLKCSTLIVKLQLTDKNVSPIAILNEIYKCGYKIAYTINGKISKNELKALFKRYAVLDVVFLKSEI